jgi:hypothetical protein
MHPAASTSGITPADKTSEAETRSLTILMVIAPESGLDYPIS